MVPRVADDKQMNFRETNEGPSVLCGPSNFAAFSPLPNWRSIRPLTEVARTKEHCRTLEKQETEATGSGCGSLSQVRPILQFNHARGTSQGQFGHIVLVEAFDVIGLGRSQRRLRCHQRKGVIDP